MDDESDEDLLNLGRMVEAARRLEGKAYDVARALGVLDPEKKTADDALKACLRQAREGLPPWARDVTFEEIRYWVDGARASLRERHGFIHWTHHARYDGNKLVPLRVSPRTLEERQNVSGELPTLARRLGFLGWQGHKLHMRLLLEMRPGVHPEHPLFARDPASGVKTYIDGGDLERPTDEEWSAFRARPVPAEWNDWPRNRLESQRRPRDSEPPSR